MRFVRRRAHRGVALGAVAALIALVGLGVLWQRSSDDRAGQEALRRAEQVARSGRTTTAAELSDKPFDRLVIWGTAGADDIRRAVGTDWRRADELAYHCCDPAPIWAFVNDNRVVAFFRASSEMSFGEGVLRRELPPERAPLAERATAPRSLNAVLPSRMPNDD